MKTKTLTFALTLVTLGMLAGNLFGQSNMKLRATVPFDFVADSKVLPAGEYEITQLQENVLVLRNVKTHSSTIESTVPDAVSARARGVDALVFHSIQGQHFLVQITTRSAESAHKLPVSEKEKELAKVNPNAPLEIVSVVANAGK